MLTMMFKYWVRLAMPFFAKRIRFTGKEQLAQEGPLILAVNHPNSFLDAMLLGVFMHHPVHYLARGDVFRIAWVRWLLTQIKMLPIYRIRDGKDKLSLNDQTFEKSREILEKNGILLVFVEGFCEHQTTLQLPLKKGAPRVIEACWRKGVPVRILPIWLQYSSFTAYPKQIDISMGAIIEKPADIANAEASVIWQKINDITTVALKTLENQAVKPKSTQSVWAKSLLFLPAMLGALLHAPLYLPLKTLISKATRDNVHYDSVLLAALVFTYPFYLLAIAIVLKAFAGGWPLFFLPLIVMPLLARCYVLWK
jgi:1-acyl-sn-glycerol-3-phosphate acyltransferase